MLAMDNVTFTFSQRYQAFFASLAATTTERIAMKSTYIHGPQIP